MLSVGTGVRVLSEATRPDEVLEDVVRNTVGKETFLHILSASGDAWVVNAAHVVYVTQEVDERPRFGD